ncbi:hypothetical protein JQK87_17965 [Streptomyces sp. G44]|uniref:hypothetical protein n=1 Tax=Streptomyces sp. G44 TaxID=2807632 RepID=UPI001961BFA2|nr:hypothetical protein [Streptomyces sp. G44]MBM7170253.1 hypothetical protein [Streptomyces sp. G44]
MPGSSWAGVLTVLAGSRTGSPIGRGTDAFTATADGYRLATVLRSTAGKGR